MADIRIQSIWGGISGSQYFYNEGEYLAGVAIDPDYPISSSDIRTSGLLCPTIYEEFSGSNVTGFPNWFATSIKNTNVYAYMSDGKFVSYSSSLTSEALISTISSSAGNGMAYYNNYIYLASGTQIYRYGPLSGVPAMSNALIANGELLDGWNGGTDTLLTNLTYPTLKGSVIPNHPMHVHLDGYLYVGDTNSQGKGVIHRISTIASAGTQGLINDTTRPSTYQIVTLPFNWLPTAIESVGTDLCISCIQTTDSVINQGRSALFFWNPTQTDNTTLPYKEVLLPDPLCTAIQNVNGSLVIWSGNAQNGVRVTSYTGGESVQTLCYQEEGTPPQAGAVDAVGDKFVWGGNTTYPVTYAGVFSYGSKNSRLPSGIHSIVRSTATGTTPTVTAVKVVQQSSNIIPQVIVGHGSSAGYGIDKRSTSATYNSVWRSQVIPVGNKFSITNLRIPFAGAVTAGVTITPTIYLDDGSSSVVLTTINNTNFPSSRKADYKQSEIGAIGQNNFYIELTWTGTVNLPVALPIVIDLTPWDGEPRQN